MQRGFVEAGQAMEVPPAREALPRIQELLAIFREKGLPVVFTEFTYSPAAPLLVGELHPEHRRAAPGAATGFGRPSSSCLEGDPSASVVAELAPRADELVVRKHYYDGFNGTVLDGALRARGVTTLVVTGTMTDICVLATVIGAFNREYRVLVVEDASGHALARDPARHPRHHPPRLRPRPLGQGAGRRAGALVAGVMLRSTP